MLARRLSLCLMGSLPILWLASCPAGNPSPDPAPQTGQISQRIIDGVPDTKPEHKAVVSLGFGPGTSFCSGTLIAPRVVLTAAHCIDSYWTNGTRVLFGNDVDASNVEVIPTTEIQPHPRYNGDTFEWDIGLVRLQYDAPADATPIPFLPASLGLTAADDGGPVEFSGFGLTETDSSGAKLRVETVIGRVCLTQGGCSYASGGWVAYGDFGYSMSGGGPCSGDSGGPAFVTRDGTTYVAGVTSYGDQGCDFYGASTMPQIYEAWINAFINGQGEDCATPGDEDADELADCADPDCDSHPDCSPASCFAPETVGCGSVIEDTTETGTFQLRDYQCAPSNMMGPEHAYRIDVPRGVPAAVRLIPDNVDLDLIWLPSFGAECASWDCLGASLSTGGGPEVITFTGGIVNGYFIVDSVEYPGPYTLRVECDIEPEDCVNYADDDRDGFIDCEDPDCVDYPDCQPPPENCWGGLDEDLDGLIDCADPDCAPYAVCGPQKSGCQAAAGGSAQPQDFGWLLLGLGLLFGWRRRRRG